MMWVVSICTMSGYQASELKVLKVQTIGPQTPRTHRTGGRCFSVGLSSELKVLKVLKVLVERREGREACLEVLEAVWEARREVILGAREDDAGMIYVMYHYQSSAEICGQRAASALHLPP